MLADTHNNGNNNNTVVSGTITGVVGAPIVVKTFHRALKHTDHSISTSAAHAYINALQKSYCNTYDKILNLSEEDMRELSIPIGHRAAVRAAAADSRDHVNVTPSVRNLATTEGGGSGAREPSNNNRWISIRGQTNQFRAFCVTMHDYAIKNGFTSVNAEDVRGLTDMQGKDYLPIDLETIPDVPMDTATTRENQRKLQIPTSMASNDFMKLFDPNQQMPIIVCHASARTFGLRIRVPDLECVRDEDGGANIQDITNRICFLVKDVIEMGPGSMAHSPTDATSGVYGGRDKPGGLVITFDACDQDPLRQFYREEWGSGEFNGTSVDEVVAEMILAVLQVYTEGVRILREQADDLDDPKGDKRHTLSDADLVRAYATVAKRAGVFRRCAEATRESIQDLGEQVHWMRSHCVTINDAIDSIVVSADEVAGNASASMDLTIALSDFAGNHNMKLFTYVTILLQPVAVGTGWYGMNWVNFPELPTENGYRNFALIIWGIAVGLLILVARIDIWAFIGSLWWRLGRCCSGESYSSSERRKSSTDSEPSSGDDKSSPVRIIE